MVKLRRRFAKYARKNGNFADEIFKGGTEIQRKTKMRFLFV